MKRYTFVFCFVLLLFLSGFFCSRSDQENKDSISINKSPLSVEIVNKFTLKTDPEEHFQNPIFSPNSKKIFFTSSNYRGIYAYDLSTERLQSLNDATGSGYQFGISSDGSKVYYRADAPMVKKRRRFMLYEQNIKNGETRQLLKKPVRNISTPRLINDNLLVYTLGDSLKLLTIDPVQERTVHQVMQPFHIIQNNKLMIYNSGAKKYENNFAGQQLLWPDFSKKDNRLIVYISGKGLQLIAPDMNESRLLGNFRAAKWSPFENLIVYMQDVDDGERILESDIFIYNLEDGISVNVSNTPDQIEMYPDWSPDGTKIAYHTDRGKIEVLELNIK